MYVFIYSFTDLFIFLFYLSIYSPPVPYVKSYFDIFYLWVKFIWNSCVTIVYMFCSFYLILYII